MTRLKLRSSHSGDTDGAPPEPPPCWLILIVDDDEDLHSITRLALRNVEFHNRKLQLASAYSAEEARKALQENTGVAVILLDVVMESDDAGLELARQIREELGNHNVRIILRTGQPGMAPERDVILRYDINDYKNKTELDAQKLYTSVISALRAYESLCALETHHRGLRQIIEAPDYLQPGTTLQDFAKDILSQLLRITGFEGTGLILSPPQPSEPPDAYTILCGSDEITAGESWSQAPIPAPAREAIKAAFQTGESQFSPTETMLFIGRHDEPGLVAYLDGHTPDGLARNLLEVFDAKAAISLHNMRLHNQLADANATLEEKVVARTQELEQTHLQLLQSEKLASIGQLAAGVAHEINNPIGFVSSNLGSLENYIKDLMSIIDAAEAVRQNSDDENPQWSDFKTIINDLELDYLRQDIPDVIAETRNGLERVRKIVQDLRDFTRAGEGEEWRHSPIEAQLESALAIAWNEIKYKAEVIKEYGDVGEIECLPGQLNQVLLNLLVNAAQAIESSGKIWLRTGFWDQGVWVEVQDNGAGIPEETRKRIFDPFFTTKPVGKGTGLGLAISHSIIERHGGRIEVDSTPGQGSRFRLWLLSKRPPQEQEKQ
ncbi:ATP-binding protein [Hahella sp. CR1]|uniref:ATP-binding protein n=1 Tax=Hahella sp. CR1 TaxID=2992807 RepID=UPI00244297A7|nr:ATP-binding protein [Hahella sp. CR1]